MTATSLRLGIGPRIGSQIGTAAVDSGELAFEVLGGSSDPMLAIHGISSQRRRWNWLHPTAPDLTLIAPELRGCGDDSIDVAGPSVTTRYLEGVEHARTIMTEAGATGTVESLVQALA